MGKALGQPVVVENRPGVNGILGAEAVARNAPDGQTLRLAPREVFGINPALHRALPHDPLHGFAWVAIATTGPYVLVLASALGVASVAELATLARQRELAYTGFGSMAHLSLEALARDLGFRMIHAPHRGAPPAVMAVVAGSAEDMTRTVRQDVAHLARVVQAVGIERQ